MRQRKRIYRPLRDSIHHLPRMQECRFKAPQARDHYTSRKVKNTKPKSFHSACKERRPEENYPYPQIKQKRYFTCKILLYQKSAIKFFCPCAYFPSTISSQKGGADYWRLLLGDNIRRAFKPFEKFFQHSARMRLQLEKLRRRCPYEGGKEPFFDSGQSGKKILLHRISFVSGK